MDASKFSWTTPDGIEIQGQHWKAEKAVAAVGFVHGMGEHMGRYNHLAEAFAQSGIASMAYDRRGHGLSGGKRGHTISYEAYIEEIKTLVTHLQQAYGKIPLFLYGHSMGGNLVLNYLIDQSPPIQGVIASAPWIELGFKPSPIKVKAGRIIKSLLPGLSMKNELDPAGISRDPVMVQAYIDDPLVHDKITPNTGVNMLEKAADLNNYSGAIDLPLLIMHGDADPIIDFAAAKAFAERISGPVTFKPWDGGFHEIHNDINRIDVINYAKEWLLEQTKSA